MVYRLGCVVVGFTTHLVLAKYTTRIAYRAVMKYCDNLVKLLENSIKAIKVRFIFKHE